MRRGLRRLLDPPALGSLPRGRTDRVARVECHSDLVDSAAIVRIGPAVEDEYPDREAVCTFSDPADLTGIGIAITNWLAGLDDPTAGAVLLGSLATMGQSTDRERTTKSLHATMDRFRSRGATLHCHFDPDAHDDATVAHLASVFDERRRERPGHRETTGNAPRVSTDGGF